MKPHSARHRKSAGSILTITLCVAVVIGIAVGSYLILLQNQSAGVARSQAWNRTMVITEAGIEDGLQLLNKNTGQFDLVTNWVNTYSADGWTKCGANPDVYYVTRSIGSSDTFYEVYITNVNNAPVICSVGHAPPTISYGQVSPGFFASTGVNAAGLLSRRVLVQTRFDSLFNAAMAAKGTINMNGNNVMTDSFDSSDPLYSNSGQYSSSRRKANGNVYTDDTVTNSLNIGNANIYGHIKTGPNGTVSIGPRGLVGDLTWTGNPTQIQPGYSSSDMNVNFTDVSLPANFNPQQIVAPAVQQNYTVNGVTYAYAIMQDGDYVLPSLTSSLYVATNAHVRLEVTGNISLNGNEQILIDGSGSTSGSLTLYMAGQSADLGGNGVVNQTGIAADFLYFGLPSNTQLQLGGDTTFVGAIYAPEADFTLKGGGNNNGFVGSSVTKTVTLTGNYSFHYDESLARLPLGRAYVPTKWTEI